MALRIFPMLRRARQAARMAGEGPPARGESGGFRPWTAASGLIPRRAAAQPRSAMRGRTGWGAAASGNLGGAPAIYICAGP
jgi:hypothetical protein